MICSILLWCANFPMTVLAAPSNHPSQQFVSQNQIFSSNLSFNCWIKEDATIYCWGQNSQGQTVPPAGMFIQVSVGGSSACAIRTDGTLACWGRNNDGQSIPPAGVFTHVEVGYAHACALQSDGAVVCWGSNEFGQLTPPVAAFVQISTNAYHTCGLQSDGVALCWGRNNSEQLNVPSETFIQISVGYGHSCGLREDGSVVCWGLNENGQLLSPAETFVQVDASAFNTCGIKNDGAALCWGSNTLGESSPPAGSFNWIGLGSSHGCGMRDDDILVCWGSNSWGQLNPIIISGHAAPSARLSYMENGIAKSTVANGNGIYSFTVPYNWSGVVTPSKTGISFLPSNLSYTYLTLNQPEQDYIQAVVISGYVGVSNASLKYIDGTLKTVTANSDGSYAIVVPNGWSGKVTPVLSGFRFEPASRTYTNLVDNLPYYNTYKATSGNTFPQIDSGNTHTCLLKSDGTISCWGNNDWGQATPPAGRFTQISAGESLTCGVRSNGSLACWGRFYTSASQPTGTFKQVSVGYSHACALRSDGKAVCWGDNDAHQSSPVPSGTFAQIEATGRATCALRSNGMLVCWGADVNYAPTGIFKALSFFGNGCVIKQDQTIDCWPVYRIKSPDGSFTEVSVGLGFACAIKRDNTVGCWGTQGHQIAAPSGIFFQISAAANHVCGLKVNNEPFCWGSNEDAQLEPNKLSFRSDSDSGLILESSETSNVGGVLDHGGMFALGDDIANRQYRAFFSFDGTKFLLDNAVIKKVDLKIRTASPSAIMGSDPFNVLGNLLVDIRKGPFGKSFALELSDFNAKASATSVGIFNKVPVKNWYTAHFTAAGLNSINKIGPTQVRLYFSKDDNNNFKADSRSFYTAFSSMQGSPILIIEYSVP